VKRWKACHLRTNCPHSTVMDASLVVICLISIFVRSHIIVSVAAHVGHVYCFSLWQNIAIIHCRVCK